MRRPLAIAMVVLFWLPPVFALLPGTQDAGLPACCRRHGAHHCAMEAMSAAQAGPGHLFAAPRHCPLYRNAMRATVPVFVPPVFALVHSLPALRIFPRPSASAALEIAAASSSRGPPFLG